MRAPHEMNKAITSTMDLRAALEILLERSKGERRKGCRSLATLVFITKTPVIVKSAQADPRVRDPEFYRKHNLNSYRGVSLIVKEQV
jgi:hypothetical protein